MHKLKGFVGPWEMAVFLSLSMVIASTFALKGVHAEERGILGGPVPSPTTGVAEEAAFLRVASAIVFHDAIEAADRDESPVIRGAGFPLGGYATEAGVVIYRVGKGDTLSHIARDFGISVQTIIEANPKVRITALRVGEELRILPVSGVIHTVEEGETLGSIVSRFQVSETKIREFNHAVDVDALTPGASLIIPGGKNQSARSASGAPLPNLSGYFRYPAEGFNWGKLHHHNAVDIANTCGTSVVASAEGLVADSAEDGWNGGYGHYLAIEHPNGTKTRYAHLDNLLVSVGDYVAQRQGIGTMGNTGNVHGVTGCHLHFEIVGAQNPFVK